MIKKILNKIKEDCREFVTARKRIEMIQQQNVMLYNQFDAEKKRSIQYWEQYWQLHVVTTRYFCK